MVALQTATQERSRLRPRVAACCWTGWEAEAAPSLVAPEPTWRTWRAWPPAYVAAAAVPSERRSQHLPYSVRALDRARGGGPEAPGESDRLPQYYSADQSHSNTSNAECRWGEWVGACLSKTQNTLPYSPPLQPQDRLHGGGNWYARGSYPRAGRAPSWQSSGAGNAVDAANAHEVGPLSATHHLRADTNEPAAAGTTLPTSAGTAALAAPLHPGDAEPLRAPLLLSGT